MNPVVKKGSMALAVAAAGLFAAGCSSTGGPMASNAPVHCAGINSCKGTSACKTANNGCKGQNSCKGQGFLDVKSTAECTDKGGKVLSMN